MKIKGKIYTPNRDLKIKYSNPHGNQISSKLAKQVLRHHERFDDSDKLVQIYLKITISYRIETFQRI